MKQLVNIQNNLKAPKGQFNAFGKYKYRSCEDILESVKPLLADEGLYLTITDEIVLVGDRYYIKATATVSDGDTSVSVDAYAREAETKKGMDDSQITGSTSSYARKYALNGLFAIDDTKDSDVTNKHDKEEKKEPKASQEKLDNMYELVKVKKKTSEVIDFIHDNFKKSNSKEMTDAEVAKTIEWLKEA